MKIGTILEDIAKGQKSEKIKDSIINRHPVTFYYSSNDKEVKKGTRIRGELVALGLSKKGNTIVRGYVEPPSVSKKGFNEHGWRTFRVDRMSNINVMSDETFDVKRPGYKDGDESKSGPMDVTYVTANWDKKPNEKEPVDNEPQDTEQPQDGGEPQLDQPTPTPEPNQDPEVDGRTDELPEPKDTKPSEDPMKDDFYVKSDITPDKLKVSTIGNQNYMLQSDYDDLTKMVYSDKEFQWSETQKSDGKNTRPGQGTRKKFDIETNMDVSDIIKNNNIKVVINLPEDENREINENIQRIKKLMTY